MDMLINKIMKNSKLKILVILFLTLSTNSCKEVETVENINFDRLDVLILLSKTIHSFEINSQGEVLELEKNQNEQKFFKYNFTEKQLEIFREKINLIVKKNKEQSHNDINSVDGTSYVLRINKGDKILYEIESVFGDELNEVDDLIVFILKQKDINKKQMLFEEYLEYEKMVQNLNEALKIK